MVVVDVVVVDVVFIVVVVEVMKIVARIWHLQKTFVKEKVLIHFHMSYAHF